MALGIGVSIETGIGLDRTIRSMASTRIRGGM